MISKIILVIVCIFTFSFSEKCNLIFESNSGISSSFYGNTVSSYRRFLDSEDNVKRKIYFIYNELEMRSQPIDTMMDVKGYIVCGNNILYLLPQNSIGLLGYSPIKLNNAQMKILVKNLTLQRVKKSLMYDFTVVPSARSK